MTAANTALPFEEMDTAQQTAHLLVKHNVSPRPGAETEQHDRRHQVDLDVDHTHEVRV
jgi:hypothetical protein